MMLFLPITKPPLGFVGSAPYTRSIWLACCVICLLLTLAMHCEANMTDTAPTSSTSAIATTPSNTSALEQFALGDYEARSQLLQTWPDKPAILDLLLARIAQNQVYRDAQGTLYYMPDEQTLLSYASQAPITPWPDSLEQITLGNALESEVEVYQAVRQLASANTAERLAATQILAQNATAVDPTTLKQHLASEKNKEIRDALALINAQQQLSSDVAAEQIAAAKVLAHSNDPVIFALLQDKHASSQNALVKEALQKASTRIQFKIKCSEWLGYVFSGISLASILLLAALGLAITYGLLGVINMAHGELIMIGAYTTYVVQNLFTQFLPNAINWYLLASIPTAFLVTACVGMVIERVVIKPLYGRQLETLLATFGVSLILMQVIRMLFGAQNVEVANPVLMSGGWVISPSLTIPYSRIVIIAFTGVVLLAMTFLITKTRFGLFVRAVTQNRQMARAVGVNASKIDMLAFGLGSGLAGLAGCALSQIGNVGPDLGQNYIIDTFLVVVVGGVGQIWGAVLAALGLGLGGKFLEVGIGAVLAKIILLVLIVLFIQKRPQGLFAIKGRFVE